MDIEAEAIVQIESTLKELKISKNRYIHIISYIKRMIKDYKGHPIDIIKEIPLNLKGNERYFAMFITGSYLSPLFYEMDDTEKTKFVTNVADALKFSDKQVAIIAEYLSDTIRKQLRENVATVEVIKKIINSQFTDAEKDYTIFIFGLVLV